MDSPQFQILDFPKEVKAQESQGYCAVRARHAALMANIVTQSWCSP